MGETCPRGKVTQKTYEREREKRKTRKKEEVEEEGEVEEEEEKADSRRGEWEKKGERDFR